MLNLILFISCYWEKVNIKMANNKIITEKIPTLKEKIIKSREEYNNKIQNTIEYIDRKTFILMEQMMIRLPIDKMIEDFNKKIIDELSSQDYIVVDKDFVKKTYFDPDKNFFFDDDFPIVEGDREKINYSFSHSSLKKQRILVKRSNSLYEGNFSIKTHFIINIFEVNYKEHSNGRFSSENINCKIQLNMEATKDYLVKQGLTATIDEDYKLIVDL